MCNSVPDDARIDTATTAVNGKTVSEAELHHNAARGSSKTRKTSNLGVRTHEAGVLRPRFKFEVDGRVILFQPARAVSSKLSHTRF